MFAGNHQMLNKTLTLPAQERRLSVRHRWDAHGPVPAPHSGPLYPLAVTAVLGASVLYSIAIVLGLDVPSLHTLPVSLSAPAGVVLDLALLLLALMHFHFIERPYAVLSGRQLRRPPAKRSQDRLLVSALLSGFFFAWQPLPDLVWTVTAPPQLLLFQTGWYAGWLSLLLSAALIEAPSFLRIALRAGVLCCAGHATRVARAGILGGLLLVEWCAAQMSLGHLLFAGVLTAYLGITPLLYRRNVNAASCRSSARN
ncbi:MAG TPA: hypothetical protein VF931_08385 [Steroidobacteraceae bacterium]